MPVKLNVKKIRRNRKINFVNKLTNYKTHFVKITMLVIMKVKHVRRKEKMNSDNLKIKSTLLVRRINIL